jgi:6-phosphogluconate dehydrogenase
LWCSAKEQANIINTDVNNKKEGNMQLGMIGLGRMGGNMASRIREAGHTIVGYDRAPDSGRDVDSLEELVAALEAPRTIWVMLPAGVPTDSTVSALGELLSAGDLVIDGGNTKYTDDAPHQAQLAGHGIHFLEAGVSGGVWGPQNGYALMIGGDAEDFNRALPIFEALKPEGQAGLVLAGPVGAGHFAKMVHNGIEYGMMQALGEGYATMTHSELIKNPTAVIDSWTSGTVIKSWLLDLLALALKKDPDLASMPPVANESGEARWMVEVALELGVPVPATTAALFARQTSRGGSDDALKVVSALRGQFGGHITAK